MSIKRQATTELNHENWDQDDPTEQEEMGTFKAATKEVLEKRVIRTAKRRSQLSSSDDAKRSIFSGFGGFNKSQPSSFDFLANLTNGNKTTNEPLVTKNETTVSANPFKTSTSESVFQSSQSPSLFGGLSTKTSVFTALKSNSTPTDSPFRIQNPSSLNTTNTNNTPMVSKTFSNTLVSSSNQTSSAIFTTSKTDINKPILPTSTSTPFKIQSISSNTEESTEKLANKVQGEEDNINDDNKKLKYYCNLKGLNESVSAWIVKHVKETPLCILTPIFRDYEKYLIEIQEEYLNSDKEENPKVTGKKEIKSNVKSAQENLTSSKTTSVVSSTKSLFAPIESSNTKSFIEINPQTKPFSSEEKSQSFFLGLNNSFSNTTPNAEFSSGVNTTTLSISTANSFSFGTNTTTTSSTNGTAPFSFGNNKPFSFNSNILKPTESKTNETEEDEPPKVEFTPIVEENSVYDKRCKIFIKKDTNFIDKGVGTLYIKKIEETGKYQLLGRANTNLGTVLLNFILGSTIPTQRVGKNNVMMVCIPTPDTKPPPTPILIRVKTPEEADELLSTLNKYKA